MSIGVGFALGGLAAGQPTFRKSGRDLSGLPLPSTTSSGQAHGQVFSARARGHSCRNGMMGWGAPVALAADAPVAQAPVVFFSPMPLAIRISATLLTASL